LPHPSATLFPYTTLFRSLGVGKVVGVQRARILALVRFGAGPEVMRARAVEDVRLARGPISDGDPLEPAFGGCVGDRLRGEHHLVAAQTRHRTGALLVPDRPHDLVVLPGKGDILL